MDVTEQYRVRETQRENQRQLLDDGSNKNGEVERALPFDRW